MKQVSRKIAAIVLEDSVQGRRYGIGGIIQPPVREFTGVYYHRANRVAQKRVDAFARPGETGCLQHEQSGKEVEATVVRAEEVSQQRSSFEKHFENWCDEHGITAEMVDPAGRTRDTSRIWYEKYCAAPDGFAMEPWQDSVKAWLYSALFDSGDDISMSG
jgi:hypothetical protein